MSIEIKAVQRDENVTYEAFQIEDTEESIAFALSWLMPDIKESNYIEAHRVLVSSWAGNWLVQSSEGGLERVAEVDFAADWSVIEEDPLARLEEEFATPALSDEMKARGEFTTKEVWEFEMVIIGAHGHPGPPSWVRAVSEDDSRAEAKAIGTGRVRVQTKTTVTSPWRVV